MSSELVDDLVDDELAQGNDIVSDRGLNAIVGKKTLSKDKEKSLAEDDVDKAKGGAEEIDEESVEDSQFSLATRARARKQRQMAAAGVNAEDTVHSLGLSESELEAVLKSKSLAAIFGELTVRWDDVKAEADQTFLVDGDALLVQILASPALSFSSDSQRIGGQFLHAVYQFERTLASLTAGGRQMRLVWFDSVGASIVNDRSDVATLRELLQWHTASQCRVLQDRFPHWRDAEFHQYIERVDPAFIVLGDGHAGAYSHSQSIVLSGTSMLYHEPSALFQLLTLDLLSHNFRCIRLSELTASVSAIHAFQYSMAIEYQHILRKGKHGHDSQLAPASYYATTINDREQSANLSTAESLTALRSLLSSAVTAPSSRCSLARLTIIVHALLRVLSSQSTTQLSAAIELSKLILTHAFFQSTLAITDRALSNLTNTNFDDKQSQDFLHQFFDQSLHAVMIIRNSSAADIAADASIADYFDLRLLTTILQQLKQEKITALGLTRAQAQDLQSVWSLLASRLSKESVKSDFLPLLSLTQLAPEVDVESAEAQAAREAEELNSREARAAVTEMKAAVSESKSKTKPAIKKEAQVKASWDDEDADEAAEEEEVDDWMALADEDEEKQDEDEAANEENLSKATESMSLDSSSQFPSLPTIAAITNPVVSGLVGDVDAELQSAHLLEARAAPSLPSISSRFLTSYDPALHSVDIVKEGDITKDRKAMRHHQRQINFMKKYVKSLTGGKIIQREVIVKDAKKAEDANSKAKHSAVGGKAAKGGKKALQSNKDAMHAKTAADLRTKDQEKLQRAINYAGTMKTLRTKIETLDSATEAFSSELVLPALYQLLDWQLQMWRELKPLKAYVEAVRAWTIIQDIYRRFKGYLDSQQMQTLHKSLTALGFTDIAHKMAADYAAIRGVAEVDVRSSIKEATKTYGDVSVGMSASRFQLEHGGPFMLRNMSSTRDPRVEFYPDAWQVKLLDVVDARHSALLVAPTSAGKSFISYYAMKQTLKENANAQRSKHRGVIVYVAPNKALVNQVSGDVYSRHGDVFGVLTNDWQYRVLTCDVLITVPSSLEALLLDPTKYEWAQQIRYVIFDEVHMIGSEEGLVWERCIHIAQHAPFLALSATVGNASVFHSWLAKCQAFHSRPVHLIEHSTRWADLEKAVYLPLTANLSEPFSVSDLHKYDELLRAKPELASIVGVHPAAAINSVNDLQERRSFPAELAFSPNDSLSLFNAMKKAINDSNNKNKLPKELVDSFLALDPDSFFQTLLTITKTDAMDYERALKSSLTDWLAAGQSALVGQVVDSLSSELRSRINAFLKQFESPDDSTSVAFQLQHFMPLLTELNSVDKLPAIVFCHDQLLCNQLVESVVEQLERMQEERRKLEHSDESERQKQKEREKLLKAARRLRDKQKNRAQEEELAREGMSAVVVEDRDEDLVYDVDPRFSFIKPGESMDPTEMEWWLQRMLWKTGWKRSHPLVRCLFRGIGVHHGAMVKPYRDAVETLFRAKHLKVVVATQTLALGINMPAKSVVFCGDSKLLTPLQYRQMAGRAGRRGFDNVGHITFFAVPTRKILRLLKSPLLSLRGTYPTNASLPLRHLAFAEGAADGVKLGLQLFQSSVRAPFFAHSQAGANSAKQIEFHYRFACQYLFERLCLDHEGRERGIAGFVAHLHSAEPSNFILAELLLNGYLDKLTENATSTAQKNIVARKLLHVLAHLFVRLPMPAYTAQIKGDEENGGSNISACLLEPLPADVTRIIESHNRDTLEWAMKFIQVFATLELNASKQPASARQPVTDASDLKAESKTVDVIESSSAHAKGKEKEKGAKGKKERTLTPSASKDSLSGATSPTGETVLVVPSIPDVNAPAPQDLSLPPVYDALNALPLSGLSFPLTFNAPEDSLVGKIKRERRQVEGAQPTRIHAAVSPVRSPFIALSGRVSDREFRCGRELLETVRNGIYLDSTALPLLEWLDASYQALPLNSYIVDFYRHGSLEQLIEDNGLQRAKVFELLKRWDTFLLQLKRAVEQIVANKQSTIVRAFQHLQAEYHATFAKIAQQH